MTLLALTAPDRSSDLAKKNLRFRVYYPEGVSFRLPCLSETSKPGDSPKSSFHASFGKDKDLCPVSCLKCYETNTKEFRSTDINQNNKLFLSYISSHNPVTSSTLARWIKNMLQVLIRGCSLIIQLEELLLPRPYDKESQLPKS